MRRPFIYIFALLVLAAIAPTAYLLRGDSRPFGPLSAAAFPSNAELRAMEAQAGDACRCARRLKPGDPAREACWSGLQRNIDRFEHSEAMYACAPLAPSDICFGQGEGRCISKEYGGGACTSEEARILEAIFAETIREDVPKSAELANKRMGEAVQSFIRGEKVAVWPSSGPSCSG